jgi:hypothetical protein
LAVAPNQVWSWDITKLKGPAKWTYFHLYVILHISNRLDDSDYVWDAPTRETLATLPTLRASLAAGVVAHCRLGVGEAFLVFSAKLL